VSEKTVFYANDRNLYHEIRREYHVLNFNGIYAVSPYLKVLSFLAVT
jgi:hypothetical protein